MFGLPEEFDSSFLVGRSLLQVCVGLHEVIFRFDEDVEITAECEFKVTLNGEGTVYELPPRGGAAALALLQESVVGAGSSSDGTLTLTFSAGAIEFYDTSPSYECYQIRNQTQLYVV